LSISGTSIEQSLANVRRLLPGIALSSAVAVVAVSAAPYLARFAPIPAMVIALVIGIACNSLARRDHF
jgi:uncharacterized membrane protein YadS